MAGITATCCYPHVVVSLAAIGLVVFMVCAAHAPSLD
jgi:hypothetical protein